MNESVDRPAAEGVVIPIEAAGGQLRDEYARLLVRASRLGGAEAWPEFFAKNSRSFRFASRLMPSAHRSVVTGVYVFCRFTDDLVDEQPPGTEIRETRRLLRGWRDLSRMAWGGRQTGVPLLDEVVGGAGRDGVPFGYIDQLIKGMEMDLTVRGYPSRDELRVYTYRAASVVGGWITEWLGVRDRSVLDRAYSLGHAMQLTNIARDVGEDLRMGRLYLPLDLLYTHGLSRSDLERSAFDASESLPEAFPAILETFMTWADREYERAIEAIPALPSEVQKPIAVAAEVYRGIHGAIRSNGYDTLRLRAHTSLSRKARLAAVALRGLRRLKARGDWDSDSVRAIGA